MFSDEAEIIGTPFPCSRCGACCQQVGKSPLTQYLDRGDGCCAHYDEESQLCNNYDQRPLICRVDQYYKQHFQQEMNWSKFIELNLNACKLLQGKSTESPT